jgi:hypothetical protein
MVLFVANFETSNDLRSMMMTLRFFGTERNGKGQPKTTRRHKK